MNTPSIDPTADYTTETHEEENQLYSELEVTEFMERGIPFNAHLGVKKHHFERGNITLKLEPLPHFTGDPTRPALHGGLIATLADTAAGMAVFSILKRTWTTSTIDLRVDYLRPGMTDETLYANSKVIRQGSRVCVIHTTIYQNDVGGPIAMSSATYSILEAR